MVFNSCNIKDAWLLLGVGRSEKDRVGGGRPKVSYSIHLDTNSSAVCTYVAMYVRMYLEYVIETGMTYVQCRPRLLLEAVWHPIQPYKCLSGATQVPKCTLVV